MTVYAVGDIQGCLTPLLCLLDKVHFDPSKDQLWATGDLINRGPDSLGVLRFVKSLGNSFQTVLGNHDLHFLAIAEGCKKPRRKDTFDAILSAPDREEIIQWLQQQPLLYQNDSFIMVHAGIPAIWSLEKAAALATEVEQVLQSEQRADFFAAMYGNKPELWSDQLQNMERLRTITNYLTRMRVCTKENKLNLSFKGVISDIPKQHHAWFELYSADQIPDKCILFGHWAALESKAYTDRFYALDSGCAWGNQMTLLDTEKKQWFRCDC